ncbi:hypothetical protein BDZ88DRAFT_418210 [Geranomyces variabilis]|nr:hypothetical protein BDZ88DRAFT_418210 [Geranomyces variabilis]
MATATMTVLESTAPKKMTNNSASISPNGGPSVANLTLSPPDLVFQPTRSQIGVIAKVTLHNVHPSGHRPVAYKIKTNAPARYSVKPVLGVLVPGAMMDVLVRSEAPIQPEDRFLLQTIALTDEEALNMDSEKWRTLDRSRMIDTFIFCKQSTRPRTISSSSQKTPETTTSSSTSATSSLLSSSSLRQPSALSQVRVTKVDLAVFSIVCLLLGIVLPYTRSLMLLLSI